MRMKSAVATLCLAFALAVLVSVVVVPRPATADLWPHCNCTYYCETNPPVHGMPPHYPNTLGEIEFPGGGPCVENPTCQECPPLP